MYSTTARIFEMVLVIDDKVLKKSENITECMGSYENSMKINVFTQKKLLPSSLVQTLEVASLYINIDYYYYYFFFFVDH